VLVYVEASAGDDLLAGVGKGARQGHDHTNLDRVLGRRALDHCCRDTERYEYSGKARAPHGGPPGRDDEWVLLSAAAPYAKVAIVRADAVVWKFSFEISL
jgi:hypothetical protein